MYFAVSQIKKKEKKKKITEVDSELQFVSLKHWTGLTLECLKNELLFSEELWKE